MPERLPELAWQLRPYILSAASGAAALNINQIWRLRPGIPAVFYAATAAGLTSALSDAASGDRIVIPPGTYADSFTVPAGVALEGDLQSVITGAVTLSGSAALHGLAVTRTVNSAGSAAGVLGPASGTAYIRDAQIVVTNSGAGAGYGLAVGAGDVETYNSYIAGDEYAAYWTGTGRITDAGSRWMAQTCPAASPLVNGDFTANVDGWSYSPYPSSYTFMWEGSFLGRVGVAKLSSYSYGAVNPNYIYQSVYLCAGQYTLSAKVATNSYEHTEYASVRLNGVSGEEQYINSNSQWYDLTLTTTILAPGWYTIQVYFRPTSSDGRDVYIDAVTLSLNGGWTNVSPFTQPNLVYAGDSALSGPAGGVVAAWGDRSAWDVSQSGKHASDLLAGVYTAHLPPPATAGNIVIDDGGQWVSRAWSGDGSLTSGGVLTIAGSAITLSKMAALTGLSVIGTSGSATATPEALTAGSAGQVLRRASSGSALAFGAVDLESANAVTGILPVANGGTGSSVATAITALTGDVTATGPGSVAATIANAAVTLAKLAALTGLSVIGTSGGIAATPGALTASADEQVLRRAAGALGFGALDLGNSSAVGASVLGTANGGTGASSLAAAGIVAGAGAAAEVAYFASSGSISGSAGMTYDGATLTLTGQAFTLRRYGLNTAWQSDRANGDIGSETYLSAADAIGAFRFRAWAGTGFGSTASMQAVAAEAHSASARGTHLDFYAVAPASTVLTHRLRLTGDGNLLLGTTTAPTSATKTLTISSLSATPPASSPSDATSLYTADITSGSGTTAGFSGLHVRDETGRVTILGRHATLPGGQQVAVKAISANYTAQDTDYVLLCTAGSAGITVTLPAAANVPGMVLHVKKVDGAIGTVTVDGSGAETIDGAATQVIALQYDSLQIACDIATSAWYII